MASEFSSHTATDVADVAEPTLEPTLEVRRTIRATRQQVFDAWTQPEALMRWHAPAPLTVDRTDVDLRPGGHWRVQMRQPDGVVHVVGGVYREIDPPREILYSWAWEGGTFANSIVSVEFVDRGAETDVIVQQVGLPTDDELAKHEHGWIACFDRLEEMFA